MLSDFTKNSTVHGIKYIGDNDSCWTDRLFWITALFISIFACFFMIHKIYFKWQISPDIINSADKIVPVSIIPFPSVTICPEVKARKSHIDFAASWSLAQQNKTGNMKIEVLKKLEALSQICSSHLFSSIDPLNSGLKSDKIVEVLKEIGLDFSESALFCKFGDEITSCNNFFTEVLTEDGVCYSFNMLEHSEVFNKERQVILVDIYFK